MRFKNTHYNRDMSSKKPYATSQEAWGVIMNSLRPNNPNKLFGFYLHPLKPGRTDAPE